MLPSCLVSFDLCCDVCVACLVCHCCWLSLFVAVVCRSLDELCLHVFGVALVWCVVLCC